MSFNKLKVKKTLDDIAAMLDSLNDQTRDSDEETYHEDMIEVKEDIETLDDKIEEFVQPKQSKAKQVKEKREFTSKINLSPLMINWKGPSKKAGQNMLFKFKNEMGEDQFLELLDHLESVWGKSKYRSSLSFIEDNIKLFKKLKNAN